MPKCTEDAAWLLNVIGCQVWDRECKEDARMQKRVQIKQEVKVKAGSWPGFQIVQVMMTVGAL